MNTQRMRDNIMGRIAIALFGDQNNRTDEECVARAAEIGYELSGAKLRAERAEAELDAAYTVLPGTYYMDPPDGGNVERLEQLRRMAADAARYRWLRQRFRVFGPNIDGQHGWCTTGDIGRLRGPNLDNAIDAALREWK